jgi:septum formation protein
MLRIFPVVEPSLSVSEHTAKPLPPLVLASGSPRRRELLAGLGLEFEVIRPLVDEKSIDVQGLSPIEIVLKLSRLKGESVAVHHPDSLVIASDTIVVVDGDVLEKPEDEADAFRMLSRLQGRAHSVFSAIAVFHQGQVQVEALETRVNMRPLSPEEIKTYIATGEPMDKAGSYAIQGVGSLLIDSIDGCYFNVVGMSMVLLDQLCRNWQMPLGLRASSIAG